MNIQPRYYDRILRYLDNTARPDQAHKQGLLLFMKECFPDQFTSNFAEHHYTMSKLFWECYRPSRVNRFERQTYTVIHREAAKTTFLTFGIPQYLIWMRGLTPVIRFDAEGWEGSDTHDYDLVQLPPIEENLIMICSETSTQSAYFVSNIKDTLDIRDDLVQIFGPKEPKAFVAAMEEQGYDIKQIKGKWTNDAFRTGDGTVVIGKGAGQQVRGTNIGGHRPSLILTDDMYSRNNTKTEARLLDLKRWFYAELSNSLDSRVGKMFFAGTLVSDQSVIPELKESEQWFGIDKPIISFEELQKVLTDHCYIDRETVRIPSKEQCKVIQKDLTTLSWPDRHDLYYILNIYKREYEQGNLAYFYQEYLNIFHAPEEQKFRREQLLPVQMRIEEHFGQKLLTFRWNDTTWWCRAECTAAVDIASSEKATADDSVIAAGGYFRCKGKKDGNSGWSEMLVPMIVDLKGGRGWAQYEQEGSASRASRPGIITEAAKTCLTYDVGRIIFEINGTQEQIRREAEAYFERNGIRTTVEDEFNKVKKQDRILAGLEPVFQRYPHIFYDERLGPEIKRFWDQLIAIGPVETKDDWPDTVEMMFSKSWVTPIDFRIASMGEAPIRDARSRDLSKFEGKRRWIVM